MDDDELIADAVAEIGPNTYAVYWNARWGYYGLQPESYGPDEHDDVLLGTFFAADWETAKRLALDIQVTPNRQGRMMLRHLNDFELN
jgi:hypothetical protein